MAKQASPHCVRLPPHDPIVWQKLKSKAALKGMTLGTLFLEMIKKEVDNNGTQKDH